MKRLFTMLFSIAFVGLMVACGDVNQGSQNDDGIVYEEEGVAQQEEQDATETMNSSDSDDQSYMKSKMEELDFYEIEIEVSYGKDKEYEVEIEQDKDRPIKAELEDELNNEFSKGREAFDVIYPKAERLSLSSDTPEQEVIDQVLQAFELPSGYTKLEIEIKFKDGTEIDLKK